MGACQLGKKLVDLFFPARCIGCGKWGVFLCSECVRGLPRILPPVCLKCGRPEPSGTLCPTCWSWKSQIDGIRSVFKFDGLMRQAVHQLKYYHLKAISVEMGKFLSEYMETSPLPCELLVPVPLHARRLKQRGYNQSELIAKELSRKINLPVVADNLVRIKDSIPQARTSVVGERIKNVAEAFKCRNSSLKGKAILLIDDVCTSGATLESCAQALKSSGVRSVWGLTLAREI